jgi:tetratricopeptide (TPR) repeat protein
MLLTEKRHNIPTCMTVRNLLKRMSDPMDKAFFLAVYNHNKYFDLPMFLQTMKLSREDTNPLTIFANLEEIQNSRRGESSAESFYNASLFGNIDRKLLTSDDWSGKDIDALIILAEAKIRRGELEDAKLIHEYLLDQVVDLTQNQWFIINLDQAKIMEKAKSVDDAICHLEHLEKMVDDRMHSALIKVRKGWYLFIKGEREKGLDLLDSAINSFSKFGVPLFLSMAHNNRGVSRFIMEDFEGAEEDWLKTRKFAREAKSEYCEGIVLPNLADIYMKAGRFDKARESLDRSRAILEKIQDLEGLALVDLNEALLKVEMGDIDGAIEIYSNMDSTQLILIPPDLKRIISDEFIKRCREKGFPDIETRLKDRGTEKKQ